MSSEAMSHDDGDEIGAADGAPTEGHNEVVPVSDESLPPVEEPFDITPDESVYDLYTRGTALLEGGFFHQAVISLRKASKLSPESASIREALGRALFQTQHFSEAADEFQAVADRAPTNDYALFCLGRCLQMLGRHKEALEPLAKASSLNPSRHDYRMYRDRSAAVVERTGL